MNYHKGFIASLLLALIALLLVGGGTYVYTQKKQENPPVTGNVTLPQATSTTQVSNPQTTDWKIYTNNSLGFSIQYPDDAKPNVELNNPWNRMTGFGEPGSAKYFTVILFKDVAPYIGVDFGYLGATIVSKDIKLGGASGYKAVSTTTGYGDHDNPYVEFAARHNGDIYHVICKFIPRCPHSPAVSHTAPVSPQESYLGYHAHAHG